jgi:hypothetical protein
MSTLPPTSPSVPYTQIRSSLNTGDLFFLHGTSPAGGMIENLEKDEGWPPFSHVGMVINDQGSLYFWDAPGGEPGDVDCFPDPYANDPDNRIYGKYANGVHPGCRVAPLDDVLAFYRTAVDVDGFWLRQLQPAATAAQFQSLRTFINRVDGQPFPTGPAPSWLEKFIKKGAPEVTGLGLNFVFGQDRASLFYGTYFCAQLVADSYMHMGLLKTEVFPPNGYSPAAFDMDGTNRLPLVGAGLKPVVFVQWDLPTGSGQTCPPEVPPT